MSVSTQANPSSLQRDNQLQAQTQNTNPQDIANLAYALWQQRGRPDGTAERDWYDAEQQLRSTNFATAASSGR